MTTHKEQNQPNLASIIVQTAKRSCLVCSNYGSVHPKTKVRYCKDGSKTVFADSGCASWNLYSTNKPKE